MDGNFHTLRDQVRQRPDVVTFWSHSPATNAMPRAPDFMFGPQPDDFGKIYHRATNLWAMGVYCARGFSVLGPYTLLKDNEIFACPDANIHQAYQQDFLRTFGDRTKPRQDVFVPGQAVLLAGPGYRVYGHWLSDILPKLYLLHAAGMDVLQMKILLPEDTPGFGLAWLELLGISAENLIRCHPSEQTVWVEELLVPTTFHNGVRMAPAMKQAAVLLNQLIERRHGAASPGPVNQRLFLSRGQAPQNRIIRGREQLEQIAAQAGLTVVHPQHLGLLEQVHLFQRAEMVVGEYGSAMHGTLFSASGTIVCNLRGSLEHPGFVQSGLGHALHQPTGYVFGRNQSADMHSEFVVSEATFSECLELLLRTGQVDTFPPAGP